MVRVKQVRSKIHQIFGKKTSFFFSANILYFSLGIIIGSVILGLFSLYSFEKKYLNKIYPGIYVDQINFSGHSKKDIDTYFAQKSFPFSKIRIIMHYDDKTATISGEQLKVTYDQKLSAEQAYLMGRSGNFLGDTFRKLTALKSGIYLPAVIQYDTGILDDAIASLSAQIDYPEENALFSFEKGRVIAFKLSKDGRQLNQEETKNIIHNYLTTVIKDPINIERPLTVNLPIEVIRPKIDITDTNNLGIRELIGRGDSIFLHSIAGRIHNVILAASRINGVLIAPNETFSFNQALGDVSAATGYQSAYIIKDGRTVLGDGGGVCQVSTTLFRAALNSGLPIVERHAHSYRVGYYEQDSPPGIDATVYSPSYDLKIKNDTGNYILIQTRSDAINLKLVFELYGTSDGRTVNISVPKLWGQSPPPPALYQDDPTLPKGTVKQVDWDAWGAKASFDYLVTRGGETLQKQTFYSNYQPWQAVYLRGTKE